VDFKKPTTTDCDKFCIALKSKNTEKVWVHCAANRRVSAFIYKYCSVILGEPEHLIKADLDKIWKPFGVWRTFIDSAVTT
jgi:hypothetical protein